MTAHSNALGETAPPRREFLVGVGASLGGALMTPAILAEDAPIKPPKRQMQPTRIKELLARKDPLTWLFTGDSITHGALHTLGWRSYPEHFAERVR